MAVVLERIDGHAYFVNQKALEMANIDQHTQVEGGQIIIENEKPTGILIDNAMELINKYIPKFSREDKISSIPSKLER